MGGHGGKETGVMGAGAYALIGGNANGEHPLQPRLAVTVQHHAALHRTHAKEQAGGTKIVNVMVNVMQPNGGIVGDKHARVEGQLIQQRAGA